VSRAQFETSYGVYGQMAVVFGPRGSGATPTPTPAPTATPAPTPSATHAASPSG
jgi:hypothetical protein